MKAELKAAWIDEQNKILAFHEFDNSVRIDVPKEIFWTWAMEVIRSGYLVM